MGGRSSRLAGLRPRRGAQATAREMEVRAKRLSQRAIQGLKQVRARARARAAPAARGGRCVGRLGPRPVRVREASGFGKCFGRRAWRAVTRRRRAGGAQAGREIKQSHVPHTGKGLPLHQVLCPTR